MQARGGWTLLIPVKGGPRAKSRLGQSLASCPGLSGEEAVQQFTADLSAAFVHDVLTAARASAAVRQIVVVTGDPAMQQLAHRLGVASAPDQGHGLVPAIRSAAELLRTQPGKAAALDPHGPIAVLLADVPAMRSSDLDAALGAAERALSRGATMAVLPDADHVGSVLLAAAQAAALAPAFGPGSLRRHEAAGARELTLSLPRLQRDVDSRRDLQTAIDLGCGPATQAVLAQLTTNACPVPE